MGVDETEATWVETLPIELRGAARTHGRALLAYVMNSGKYQACINTLLKRLHGNRELENSINGVIAIYNDISSAYVTQRGWTAEQISTVQQDIMLAMQLAGAGPAVGKRSSGGIILPH